VVAAVLWQPERGLRRREYARWGIEREEDIAAAMSASLNPPPSLARSLSLSLSVSLSLSLSLVCISVSLSPISLYPPNFFLANVFVDAFRGGGRRTSSRTSQNCRASGRVFWVQTRRMGFRLFLVEKPSSGMQFDALSCW
jgi:hypothetical protein